MDEEDEPVAKRSPSTFCGECGGSGISTGPRGYLRSDGTVTTVIVPVKCRSCRGKGSWPMIDPNK